MRALAPEFKAYTWAPPTEEVARLAGIDPSQVVRYDQNTPPLPLPSTRPGTIASALASVMSYPVGGYPELRRAIAEYTGVDPENIVLGAGADDLILLCARAFAGPGDTIAIPEAPTYPLYRLAAQLAGARWRGEPGRHLHAAGRAVPTERCAPCPRPVRSSATRPTTSTAARRACR